MEDRATLGSDLSATMDFKEWGLPPVCLWLIAIWKTKAINPFKSTKSLVVHFIFTYSDASRLVVGGYDCGLFLYVVISWLQRKAFAFTTGDKELGYTEKVTQRAPRLILTLRRAAL